MKLCFRGSVFNVHSLDWMGAEDALLVCNWRAGYIRYPKIWNGLWDMERGPWLSSRHFKLRRSECELRSLPGSSRDEIPPPSSHPRTENTSRTDPGAAKRPLRCSRVGSSPGLRRALAHAPLRLHSVADAHVVLNGFACTRAPPGPSRFFAASQDVVLDACCDSPRTPGCSS